MLGFRQGWCDLPILIPFGCDAFRRLARVKPRMLRLVPNRVAHYRTSDERIDEQHQTMADGDKLPNSSVRQDRNQPAGRARSSDSVTTEDVLTALGKYTKESNESDRQTARKLGINRFTLSAWMRGKDQPQKCALARLAGFLRRVGYL